MFAGDVDAVSATISFEDYDSAFAQFTSTWRTPKEKREETSQTDQISYATASVQSIQHSSIQVQTVAEKELDISATMLPLDNVTSQAICSFLSKVEPLMSSFLMKNIQSSAFNGYTVNFEQEANEITCAYSFTNKQRDLESLCTDLSWNKSGSTIAVSFGRYDHESWCTHRGLLSTWNLKTTLGTSMDTLPTFTTEVSSCLMCIAFHPESPSLIAGGTFSGDVIIWQTNESTENPILASSKMDEMSHEEPIAKISWVPGKRSGEYNLVSIGTDGKLFVWSFDGTNLSVQSGSHLQMSQLKSGRSVKSTSKLGGTCISFNKDGKTTCIIGSEGGHILKCDIALTTQLLSKKAGDASQMTSNPVTFQYTPSHTGPIQSVSCSPFHRNTFLSCGSDGQLRLYNLLASKASLILEPSNASLNACDWSKSRSVVFACASSDGSIYIYSLAHSKCSPLISFETASAHVGSNSSNKSVPATCLSFNQKQPEYLCTGDAHGNVAIWRLPNLLINSDADDDTVLNSLYTI